MVGLRLGGEGSPFLLGKILGSRRGTRVIEHPALSPQATRGSILVRARKIRSPSRSYLAKATIHQTGKVQGELTGYGELKSRLVWVRVSEGICKIAFKVYPS